MGTQASTTRHVFRQRSPLGLAAVYALTAALVLLSVARTWAANPQPLFASWVLFGLAVAWAVFVRPAVLLEPGGVTLRNLVRDVHVPWAVLSDVRVRWNLQVFAGERGYTAWAISSQVERPAGAPGGMFAIALPARLGRQASEQVVPSSAASKVTASKVAEAIEAAKQEYDEAVAQGQLPAVLDGRVRITWVPLVLAVLLLPAVVVLALSLT
jgi:hypothetical protein